MMSSVKPYTIQQRTRQSIPHTEDVAIRYPVGFEVKNPKTMSLDEIKDKKKKL